MTALDPPKRVAPIFPVRDLGSAVDHYRALGFAVETYDGAPYAYARWGEVEIHLAEVGGRPSLKPKRNMSAAYLWVTDADALYTAWSTSSAGGTDHPPQDAPYGLREGAHLDEDANLLRYGSPLG